MNLKTTKPAAPVTPALPAEIFQFPEECFIPRPGLSRNAIWDAAVTLLKRTANTLSVMSEVDNHEALHGLASQLEQFGDLMDGVRQ